MVPLKPMSENVKMLSPQNGLSFVVFFGEEHFVGVFDLVNELLTFCQHIALFKQNWLRLIHSFVSGVSDPQCDVLFSRLLQFSPVGPMLLGDPLVLSGEGLVGLVLEGHQCKVLGGVDLPKHAFSCCNDQSLLVLLLKLLGNLSRELQEQLSDCVVNKNCARGQFV